MPDRPVTPLWGKRTLKLVPVGFVEHNRWIGEATQMSGPPDEPFSKWNDADLARWDPVYPPGDIYGEELRAEIRRRETRANARYTRVSLALAAASAVASMVAAIASLIVAMTH